jgi:MinD-like ATPase involved in chromosome partitioning or flagellar assembly
MEWMVPLRRLDEAQQNVLRRCANMTAQPKWVEGFAGSGKTVLLVHAIQGYVHKNPDSKVCIVVFTHALIDLIRSGIAPEFRARIPVMTYLNFVNKDKSFYDLVIVDEVQDVPANILGAIRARADKLLVGGDDAQSIYESGSRAESIESILQPERMKLPMVYRLTRKIIRVVGKILPENNIVTATSGRMEEIQVTLAHADSLESELAWVWHQAKRFTEPGHPCVVVLPDHAVIQNFMHFVAKQEGWPAPRFPADTWKNHDYSAANQNCLEAGASICLQYLGNGHGSLEDSDSRPIVYVMTYHSIKGLDFRTVFLPLLTPNTAFWRGPDIDRRLFFVGATRSRRDLFLSYHGKAPHPYVQDMPQEELHKVEIGRSHEQNDDDNFIF